MIEYLTTITDDKLSAHPALIQQLANSLRRSPKTGLRLLPVLPTTIEWITYHDECGIQRTLYPNDESIRAAISLKAVGDSIKASVKRKEREVEHLRQIQEYLKKSREQWQKHLQLTASLFR